MHEIVRRLAEKRAAAELGGGELLAQVMDSFEGADHHRLSAAGSSAEATKPAQLSIVWSTV
jgi:hypothetical protein